METKETKTIAVTLEDHQALKIIAAKSNRTLAEVIHEAVFLIRLQNSEKGDLTNGRQRQES